MPDTPRLAAVSAAARRQHRLIEGNATKEAAFRAMTLLLAVRETTIHYLAAVGPDATDSLAAVTQLRDHLAARLPRFAKDP